MDGIQKTVHLGLLQLAQNVADGKYGRDDDCFAGPEDKCAHEFLSDMHDKVIDKME